MANYYSTRPTITSIYDDVGETGVVSRGGFTDDVRPRLTGKVNPGAVVYLYDNNKLIFHFQTGRDGTFDLTFGYDLPQGVHNFRLYSQGQYSEPYAINISSVNVESPKILSLYDNVGETGNVLHGDKTDDRRPLIKGSGTPGATVTLLDNGTVIGQTRVDAKGNWSLQPSRDFALGEHNLTVQSQGMTSSGFKVEVVPVKTIKPEILEIFDRVDETGLLKPGDDTDDRRPLLKGVGTPGAVVWLMDNGRGITYTVVDKQGNWTLQPSNDLALGKHHLAVYINGVVSEPVELNVVIREGSEPVIVAIHDNVNEVGVVEPGKDSDDRRPIVSGTALPHTTIWLLDSGGILGSARSDAQGNWSIKPDIELRYGMNKLWVSNGDSVSDIYPINIVPMQGQAPEIHAVYDDAGYDSGNVAQGRKTDDARPTLSGKGIPGETVTLLANGIQVANAIVDANGHWKMEPYSDLDPGSYSLVVDSNGKKSAPWKIDIVAETRIWSLYDDVGLSGTIGDNGVTDDTRPNISGIGQPGSLVELVSGGTLLGTAIVGENGTWFIEPGRDMRLGSHKLIAISQGFYSKPFYVDIVAAMEDAPDILWLEDHVRNYDYMAENDKFYDRRPTIIGQGRPGQMVEIYDNDVLIGSAGVGADGMWRFQPHSDLAVGKHELVAKMAGIASNTMPINVIELKITQVFDDVNEPALLQPGDTTDDDRPSFKGTGLPGEFVYLLDDGVKIGSAKVNSKGEWTLEPKWYLDPGEHNLQVQGRFFKTEVFKLIVEEPVEEDFTMLALDESSLTLTSLLSDAAPQLFSESPQSASPATLSLDNLDLRVESGVQLARSETLPLLEMLPLEERYSAVA
ncbi:Ig-like domain-containing protein [uncultured Pantoea sp.]|uniref:Ig-like domain-containing protein n=1 Tax=uncultured Pantoea sp. TaxID=218084 RepID=UPI00258A771D|nr:Ig-like domain-containing protein [uncultured Pantoea sp.]